jgi:acyl carrier protein
MDTVFTDDLGRDSLDLVDLQTKVQEVCIHNTAGDTM